MKSITTISTELNNNLKYITGYERTKILILVDRVISKPLSNHRLELRYYSIRYKADDKQIYVYNKQNDYTDTYDYEYIDNIDFPNDFSIKITIDSCMNLFIKLLRIKMGRLIRKCLKII